MLLNNCAYFWMYEVIATVSCFRWFHKVFQRPLLLRNLFLYKSWARKIFIPPSLLSCFLYLQIRWDKITCHAPWRGPRPVFEDRNVIGSSSSLQLGSCGNNWQLKAPGTNMNASKLVLTFDAYRSSAMSKYTTSRWASCSSVKLCTFSDVPRSGKHKVSNRKYSLISKNKEKWNREKSDSLYLRALILPVFEVVRVLQWHTSTYQNKKLMADRHCHSSEWT